MRTNFAILSHIIEFICGEGHIDMNYIYDCHIPDIYMQALDKIYPFHQHF